MIYSVSKTTISVSVRNSNTVLFEGLAKAISSQNEKGTFDILPLHTHFISLIKQTIIIHEIAGTKKSFPIESGVLRVIDNNIDIFLGIEPIVV